MALMPSKLHQLTNEERELVDALEEQIDEKMQKEYTGYGTFKFVWEEKFANRPRILDELRRRYAGESSNGWTVYANNNTGLNGVYLEFTPKTQSSGNYWYDR